MIIQKFPHYVIKTWHNTKWPIFQRGFSTGRKYKLVQKKTAKQNISNAVCRKRKAIVFIGGRKKFGGGGEFECGMTQSNQKN